MTKKAPTPQRWARVKEITSGALDCPESERSSWLYDACADDQALRREVESLLAAHERAGDFLETPGGAALGAAEAVLGAPLPASLPFASGIGRYRIIRELGQGGMGVVYLAERADATFEKKAAIKVVHGGLASEALKKRFRHERRILATLDHPNIARLLDGGTTRDGLPYLVMEYVDGIPVDVYCETPPLPVRPRLALFLQVCAAVQYAHQHLVIHRDLKASNVLVTAAGTPKLLDFGIAKLVEPGASPQDETRTGLRALSLQSASPEQVRGEPMAVTSDVYSLGVLLYRLLAGQSPYGTERRTDPDLLRAILDDVPVRPSLVAPPERRRELRGDLDWIVLKALRKEPERRYGSVEQLSDDISRHLAGQPVLAGPASWQYLTRKYVARNRMLIAAEVLLALSLMAGVTTTLWQARRAEEQRARAQRRFNDVRKLSTAVMGELHDAIAEIPGATAARALLLTRASQYLDTLAVDAPDDPVLAEELATAYHRLGDVQGATGTANLGDRAGGRANHLKGLAIREALAARAPEDLEARSRLVDSLISAAYAEDEVGPSLERAQVAVGVARSLAAAAPHDLRFRRQLARAQFTLGSQYREIGDNAHALESFLEALPLFQAAHETDPGDGEAARFLTRCHKRLGAILNARGETAAALEHLGKAVELDEASLRADPGSAQKQRDLSVANIQLGFGRLRSGDARSALAAYGRALALRESLVRADARDAQAPHDVASALWYIGVAENALRHWPAAIASFERAMPLSVPPMSDRDDLRASILSALADAHEGTGRLGQALQLRREGRQFRRTLLAAKPDVHTLRRNVAADDEALGNTLAAVAARESLPSSRRSRWREAQAAYAEGLDVIAALEVEGKTEPEDKALGDRLRQALLIAADRSSSPNAR